jgi:hypothetical protein
MLQLIFLSYSLPCGALLWRKLALIPANTGSQALCHVAVGNCARRFGLNLGQFDIVINKKMLGSKCTGPLMRKRRTLRHVQEFPLSFSLATGYTVYFKLIFICK